MKLTPRTQKQTQTIREDINIEKIGNVNKGDDALHLPGTWKSKHLHLEVQRTNQHTEQTTMLELEQTQINQRRFYTMLCRVLFDDTTSCAAMKK